MGGGSVGRGGTGEELASRRTRRGRKKTGLKKLIFFSLAIPVLSYMDLEAFG